MTMTVRQHEYLKLLGIDVWVSRDRDALLAETGGVDTTTVGMNTVPDSDWTGLREQVAACTNCPLHHGRTMTVFGSGSETADWMVIGEAPGAEEDRQGEPFVGRAGQLLTSMLKAMGIQRQQVYIANIIKCRPPANRDPAAEEVAACESYLQQQIAHVRPRIILALGRVAAQNLLKVDTPIGRLRGQCFEYAELQIPVVVTYHPAYLLRSPKEKRKAWDDLQVATNLYAGLPA